MADSSDNHSMSGEELLAQAIMHGMLPQVKQLVESGVDCHGVWEDPVRNGDRQSYAHIAACQGETAILKYLIEEKKCDVNQRCSAGTPMLLIACDHGHYDVVKLLIKNGADCNAVVGDRGDTLCHRAVALRQPDVLRLLVKEGKANINRRNVYGGTPLHVAAHEGDLDIFKLVVDLGGNYKEMDIDTRKALHFAAVESRLDIVKYLVEELDQDPDKLDLKNQGMNLLHFLFSKECLSPDEVEDQYKVFEYLVKERKMDVNKVTEKGITPLHLACLMKADLKVVKLLVDAGANCNAVAVGVKGYTPLYYAAGGGKADVVKFLLKQPKVDINLQNAIGTTPLHGACHSRDLKTFNLLIEKGADLNITTGGDGFHCLHIAAQENSIGIVKNLISQKGIDVNKCLSVNGVSALHLACARGHLDMVKLLIKNGANINLLDNVNQSCIHYAAGNNKTDVVKYLVEEKKMKLTKPPAFRVRLGSNDKGPTTHVAFSSDGDVVYHHGECVVS